LSHDISTPDHSAQNPEIPESPNLNPKSDQNGTEIALVKSESGQDIESVEREHILKVLAEVNGSRTKAVEILGISARALRYKLKSYKEAGFLNE
jgi:two-component system response regulator FlrC